MTPQEALEQVAPRGRAAPKLKNALREDAYEVFEAWASQSAAAAAEDLAAATARSNDAGREAAAIKAAMDKKKKKKSMAEADYAPDAPPPLSPVAAVDAELRAHLDKLRADAAPSGASLVADLERLVADAAAAGGDDPRLPLWTLKLRWHRLALRGDGGGDADAVASDDGARWAKLNRRAAETVAEIRAAAAAALRPQVESWEDAFAKTVVSFERPLPDAADAAEPPPPPPPDDGYDRHAAAYDALLARELSDAAAKKKDGAADAAQPAEAEAPPPAKGAGWGAPGFELQHAMDYAFADVAPDAEAPPPPPATADVAPPPPPDAA
ncbi:hypothetical protein JL720_7431 [Aureococcus anophagefferens]|nr:hypothetical protein JL720_7431 [Aureococcus anophagefferens]